MTETPYGQDDMPLSRPVDTAFSSDVDSRLEPARPDAGPAAHPGDTGSDPDRPLRAARAAGGESGRPTETDLAYLPEPDRIDALDSPTSTVDGVDAADVGLPAVDAPAGTVDEVEAAEPRPVALDSAAGTVDEVEAAEPRVVVLDSAADAVDDVAADRGLPAGDQPAGAVDGVEAADPGLQDATDRRVDDAAGTGAGQAGRPDPGSAGVPTWPWEEADDGDLLPRADDPGVAGAGTGRNGVRADAGSDAAERSGPTGGGAADRSARTDVDDATGLFAASPRGEVAASGEDLADPERLRAAVEAVLLVVDTPTSATSLAQGLGRPVGEVVDALRFLRAEYEAGGRGIDLREIAEGWRLYSREDFAPYVERFVLYGQQARLTQAALETLAVIAYRQPVTRSRIAGIRGVSVDAVMRTLLTRGLVEECGADPDTGGGLYRTTRLFLEKVGLRSLDELPSLAPLLPDTSQLDDVAVST